MIAVAAAAENRTGGGTGAETAQNENWLLR
jgi:hypothetical protein